MNPTTIPHTNRAFTTDDYQIYSAHIFAKLTTPTNTWRPEKDPATTEEKDQNSNKRKFSQLELTYRYRWLEETKLSRTEEYRRTVESLNCATEFEVEKFQNNLSELNSMYDKWEDFLSLMLNRDDLVRGLLLHFRLFLSKYLHHCTNRACPEVTLLQGIAREIGDQLNKILFCDCHHRGNLIISDQVLEELVLSLLPYLALQQSVDNYPVSFLRIEEILIKRLSCRLEDAFDLTNFQSIILGLVRKFAETSLRNTKMSNQTRRTTDISIRILINSLKESFFGSGYPKFVNIQIEDKSESFPKVMLEICKIFELYSGINQFSPEFNTTPLEFAKNFIILLFQHQGPAAWNHFGLIDKEISSSGFRIQTPAMLQYLAIYGYERPSPPKRSVEQATVEELFREMGQAFTTLMTKGNLSESEPSNVINPGSIPGQGNNQEEEEEASKQTKDTANIKRQMIQQVEQMFADLQKSNILLHQMMENL